MVAITNLASYTYVYTVLYICAGADRVDLASIYKHIVPCVTNWENLGAHLGLEPYHLDCISMNNAYNPDRVKNCCRAVLKKWLELECSPTWGKLEDAVNALENSPTTNNNIAGKLLNHKLSIEIVDCYLLNI